MNNTFTQIYGLRRAKGLYLSMVIVVSVVEYQEGISMANFD